MKLKFITHHKRVRKENNLKFAILWVNKKVYLRGKLNYAFNFVFFSLHSELTELNSIWIKKRCYFLIEWNLRSGAFSLSGGNSYFVSLRFLILEVLYIREFVIYYKQFRNADVSADMKCLMERKIRSNSNKSWKLQELVSSCELEFCFWEIYYPPVITTAFLNSLWMMSNKDNGNSYFCVLLVEKFPLIAFF